MMLAGRCFPGGPCLAVNWAAPYRVGGFRQADAEGCQISLPRHMQAIVNYPHPMTL